MINQKKLLSVILALFLGIAVLGFTTRSAHAVIVNPSVSIEVFFALPLPGPFDPIEVQVGFGGFTNDSPGPGETFDIQIFDDNNTSLIDIDGPIVGNISFFRVPLILNLNSTSLRVIIDDVVGEYEIHQVSFFEEFPSGALKRQLGTVLDPDPSFVISTISEPMTLALFFAGLAGLGLARWRQRS